MTKIMGYDIEGGGWTHTTQQSIDRAKAGFDALIAQMGMYKRDVPEMKAANPALELYAYANGSHTSNAGFPDKWYLHDISGARLRSAPPWDGNFTMSPLLDTGPTATVNGVTANSWSEWIRQRILQIEAESGYDGVYIDELGTGSLTSRADGIGPAIDPRTGVEWTKDDYMVDIGVFLARVNAATSSPVWCNGLGTGYRFYGKLPWQPQRAEGQTKSLLAADGAAAELYIRGPGQGIDVYGGQPNHIQDWWRTELQMTVDAGPKLIALTKTWVPSTAAQQDRWHRYALTTALLGDPLMHFYFTAKRATTVTPYHPYWAHQKRLGAPLAGFLPLDTGAYSRKFAQGSSFVNPTNGPLPLQFPAAGSLLGGLRVTAGMTVTIPAHDGQVFVRG